MPQALEKVLTVNWTGDCITEDTSSGEMNFIETEQLTDSHQILLNLWSSCNDIVKQVDSRFTTYAFSQFNSPAVDIEIKAWAGSDADLVSLDTIFKSFAFYRQELAEQPYDLLKEGKLEKRLYTYVLCATSLTAMQLQGSVSYLSQDLVSKGMENHLVKLFEVIKEC